MPSMRVSNTVPRKDEVVYEGVPAVGSSTNVLLVYQLFELRALYWVNFMLSLYCLVYIGIMIVLIIINANHDFVDEIAPIFHNIEFWSTFLFCLTDLGSLMFSPKPCGYLRFPAPAMKFFMAVSLVTAFVPAMLVAINLDRFEFTSHNTEYVTDIIMSLIDVSVMLTLVLGPKTYFVRNAFLLGLSLLAVTCGVIELILYNVLLQQHFGEQLAHMMEFSVDILNASVMFWFITDNRLLIGAWIQHLLQSPFEGVLSLDHPGGTPPGSPTAVIKPDGPDPFEVASQPREVPAMAPGQGSAGPDLLSPHTCPTYIQDLVN